MKIIWNRVTKFSQIAAIVLFMLVLLGGFWLGKKSEDASILGLPVNSVTFNCDAGKTIHADFYKSFAHIDTAVLGSLYLPQTISASGARYANDDESIVFWNKGDTAFITQGDSDNVTYKDCLQGGGAKN